ncbi:PstS family phosphate ABC transporter substrate-binding protein [Amylibacter sp. IMCC11727]|uniref:PstS family phosphate ABC transporter substrate-binding protein n=1 Tax=Amylibacter sp. IMCC11727 TaxID=3039851 RepID=UPI00244DF99D|nr:PstS family phosphate ABC transporter substrate-binding protein [Amylibacter sp. IMCC11727]WGI21462.1 PstS family phosphate ABC transporter substrate-binding protein [Amylibacter sp. IMCC11727]
MFTKTLCATALILTSATAPTFARDQITIVGSSTVFPFSTTVAERFGKSTDFKTPVVESTGSGGGLKLFCSGVGTEFPDITNASRRIKASEVAKCAENGVTEIVEAKIGYDGIVLANSKAADQVSFSLKDLFMGLAKDIPTGVEGETKPNPFTMWNEVNPDLPAIKIEVLGPPPTSGTRDAFVELAMEGGCKSFDWINALKKTDKAAYKSLCHNIREDGAYVEAGENDNLIVQKLNANPDAFGIFGYSFLEQNEDNVQGSLIDGVEPEFDAIAQGDYPVSRSLYFYVKAAHVGVVPGIEAFLEEFTSEDAWGEEGYLADKGLIPLTEDERAAGEDAIRGLQNLSM